MQAERPRIRTAVAVSAITLTALLAAVHTARAADARANIIFVFTDDHASHAISAYGSKINQTPHIDRLAREGMLFKNCFVTNSICAPSRAVIQTGKHSHVNGVIDNIREFDNTQQTFPKLLQRGGYQTAMIGKWHLKAEPTGFDYWKVLIGQGTYYNPVMRTPEGKVKYTGYTTDIITDLALEWLDKGRDKSKPFMLMYQHKAPHREWQPGPDHMTLYDDVDIWEPPTLFDDYSNRTTAARWATMTIARHMNDLDLKFVPPRYLNEEQIEQFNKHYGPKNEAMRKANLHGKDLVRWKYQRYVKDYLRSIASVDDNLGRVLEYLDDTGLAKNTVVIYNSDQGFYLGDHGWFDKRWMYEESLRMPLIVRWPGVVKPGSVNDDLVQNLDFAETFLGIAAESIPADMQGKSIVPLLKGQTPADWRKSIYYHYYEFPGWHDVRRHYGVRTDRHKLIHYYDIGEWELFDLEKDPDELKSVYDDPAYANVCKQLQTELTRLRKECGADQFEEPPVPPNPENVELELVVGYGPAGIDGAKVVDTSGNGHHGSRQNVQLVEGRRGKALKFAEKSLIRVAPAPKSLDPTYHPLSVGAWCKPESPDGVIVSHGNRAFGYSLYLRDGVPHFITTATNLAFEVAGREKVKLGEWVHLAATVDAEARLTLLVGGRPAGRLEEGFFVSQTPRESAFVVGADPGRTVGDYAGPMHFQGLIEDLRLYWGVLDDDGIRQWVGTDAGGTSYSIRPDAGSLSVTAPGGRHNLDRLATINPCITAPGPIELLKRLTAEWRMK